MRRVPRVFLLPAIAAATAILAGCSSGSGGSSSTEAEQAMYAAVSKPVMTALSSPPPGTRWSAPRPTACAWPSRTAG